MKGFFRFFFFFAIFGMIKDTLSRHATNMCCSVDNTYNIYMPKSTQKLRDGCVRVGVCVCVHLDIIKHWRRLCRPIPPSIDVTRNRNGSISKIVLRRKAFFNPSAHRLSMDIHLFTHNLRSVFKFP